MTNNKKRYEREINTDSNYKITISEFQKWLKTEEKRKEVFKAELDNVIRKINNYYDVAVDFSIPITMVKFFLTDRSRL